VTLRRRGGARKHDGFVPLHARCSQEKSVVLPFSVLVAMAAARSHLTSTGNSMLYSFLLFIITLSLQQVYREKLASTEVYTILGGLISSILFLLVVTFIGNLQESVGARTGWGAVIVAELIAAVAAGAVHRVCVTTCFLFSLGWLYELNKLSAIMHQQTDVVKRKIYWFFITSCSLYLLVCSNWLLLSVFEFGECSLSLSLFLQFCGKGLASKTSISTFCFCLLVFFPVHNLLQPSTCPIWRQQWRKTAVAFRVSRFYIGDLIRLYTWSAAVRLAVLNTVSGIPYLSQIIGSFCWNI